MIKGILILILLAFMPAYAQFGLTEKVENPVRVEITCAQKAAGIEITIALDLAKEVHIYTSPDRFFQIEETEVMGLGQTARIFPSPEQYKDVDDSIAETYSGKKTLLLRKKYVGKGGEAWKIQGFFQYQGCDKTTCYPPEKKEFSFSGKIPQGKEGTSVTPESSEKKDAPKAPEVPMEKPPSLQESLSGFEIVGSATGYMTSAAFVEFLDTMEGKKKSTAVEDNFANKNIWLVVLIILLGGLALNLTPCVLPMIPINLAIIGAGAKAGSRARGFALGTTYGLGMSLAYGILGLVVVLTGAQFGALNASPWFNFGIAFFFAVLGLAMFDIVNIDFSRFSHGAVKKNQYGPFLTAFFMGALSALLAGACIAPVVLSVLIYASSLYTAGHTAGLLLPFLLGLGMSLPWPFAGASLSFLPKPGAWMVRVKYAFGVFILALALYYGYLGYEIWKSSKATPDVQEQKGGWMTSLSDGLTEAKLQKKPVILDFWASWCKNCLAMEKTTFQDTMVLSRLSGYVKIKYRAEDMSSAEHKPVIDYFQQALKLPTFGLPMYIVLKPKS